MESHHHFVSVNIFIYMLYFKRSFAHNVVLKTVLHYFGNSPSSSLRIFFHLLHEFVVHLKLFKNKVESDAQVEMQELFVTTNIRVLYIHWKECVRKKVNSQITALVYGTWFMQVFITFLIFLSVSSIISSSSCSISLWSLFEDRDEKLG